MRTLVTRLSMFGKFARKISPAAETSSTPASSFIWTRTFSVSHGRQAEKPTVGFIGLGNMGNHMARNLLNKGFNVLAYDVVDSSLATVKNDGGQVGSSPAEIASQVKTCVTMLPSSPNVIDVYTGENGLLRTAQSGTLFLDSSTIDPAVSQDIANKCAEKGADYMDAPVSGGVNAARDGILTFMVGGKDSRFTDAQAILQHMGKNVVHCGDVGMGQAAKICNNMLLAVSMIGVCETMNLGIKLGLDKQMLAKIINMSTGRCWSSDTYNPCPGVMPGVPASNNYAGGFGAALMTKDLGLAQNAATAMKAPTPLGSAAHQIYRLLCNNGYGAKDFGSVFQFLQEEDNK